MLLFFLLWRILTFVIKRVLTSGLRWGCRHSYLYFFIVDVVFISEALWIPIEPLERLQSYNFYRVKGVSGCYKGRPKFWDERHQRRVDRRCEFLGGRNRKFLSGRCWDPLWAAKIIRRERERNRGWVRNRICELRIFWSTEIARRKENFFRFIFIFVSWVFVKRPCSFLGFLLFDVCNKRTGSDLTQSVHPSASPPPFGPFVRPWPFFYFEISLGLCTCINGWVYFPTSHPWSVGWGIRCFPLGHEFDPWW